MADVDYYALLGIPRDADIRQIKKAYQKKARECHPDHAGPKGAEAFRLVTRAYETLSDRQKRQAYDFGFMPVVSIADLYERHTEGRKVMEIILPSAPAAKQIGPDLFMAVRVGKKLMQNGGSMILELPNR
ncbi:DnaJ domain-containing protein, partial [Candidatus Uhrbacteria bacterium]|nr:DnaJ domain-containing protein [Candidatus Uhrbacteria bacterium]